MMSEEAFAQLHEYVLAHPEDTATLHVYADALRERGDPRADYVVPSGDWCDPPLPADLVPAVVGPLRNFDIIPRITHGFLRDVSLLAVPDWDEPFRRVLHDPATWGGVTALSLPHRCATRYRSHWLGLFRAARHLRRLTNVPFHLFTAFCEEERSLEYLRIEGRPPGRLPNAVATPRLQVRLLRVNGDFRYDSVLHWIVATARPVFDSVHELDARQVPADQAHALLSMAGPRLQSVKGQHWHALRTPGSDTFAVSFSPSRNNPARRYELRVPAWAGITPRYREAHSRHDLINVAATVPVAAERPAPRRHLRVVPGPIVADQQCPFARSPLQETVVALCRLREVEGAVEQRACGAWALSLRGPGLRVLTQSVPWLPQEQGWQLLLPESFVRTAQQADFEDEPTEWQDCYSAQHLLAHAWATFAPNEEALHLVVYATWDDWRAAAPDQAEPATPSPVVNRVSAEAFLRHLRLRGPIVDALADVALSRRQLARAQAREARLRPPPRPQGLEDLPF